MILHASIYTTVAASQTAQIIAPTVINTLTTGGTIKVIGITAKNTSGSSTTVTLLDNDLVTIDTITTPAGDTKIQNIPFVAHKGLRVTTPASTTVTVYHTQIL